MTRAGPDLPDIHPRPTTISGRVPWLGAGPGLLRDPTAWLTRQRTRHGDTFAVDALGHRFFCVFGPDGVRRLYDVAEREASFGLATYTMIAPKVPDELFGDIRNSPHKLFGNQRVEGYLAALDAAMDAEIEALGSSGTFEVFAQARRIGHRLGLASWAGPEAASSPHIEPLIEALDQLDTSESFVHPLRTVVTLATRKRRERAAMARIEDIMGSILRARRSALGSPPGDFLTTIEASFADVELPRRDQLVARDVIVLHLGSQSNLFAALAWTLINVVANEPDREAVIGGDTALAERYAYESIRFAQRSITMRQVLRPIDVDDGSTTYRLEPGVLLTTMLSVTNTTAHADLAQFDPDHYDGRRLRVADELPAKELVSTFGHGTHTCPAQRFSITAIRLAVARLLATYDLTPSYSNPQPLTRQIGGVARADRPCPVGYRRRT